MRDTNHMLRICTISPALAILLCLAVLLTSYPSALVAQPASGQSEIVLSLPEGSRPEGIAVDRSGSAFLANRQFREGQPTINQILRLTSGTAVEFASLPASDPGAEGLLGLTVDPAGNIYAAFASFDANHGVWRVSRDGTSIERVPGSEAIGFPNALTFDPRGNLYVTDSFRGAIWRSHRGGPFSIWAEDPLLAPLPDDPVGFPLPGANGIAFYPPDTLYVANTELGLIASVQIDPDGTAGSVDAVTTPFAVPTVDGIAMDVRGQIHAVLPGFSLFGGSPLVRIDPVNGAVTPTVVSADASRFDTPLSVAFGGGAEWHVKTVLVTNGDLPGVQEGPGPGVVQVAVDVPGFPIP